MARNPARVVFEHLRQYSRRRRIHQRLPDPQWRLAWERAQIDLESVRVLDSGRLSLDIGGRKLELPKSDAGLDVSTGARLLKRLAESGGCSLEWDDAGDQLVVRHERCVYLVGGFEELYIAAEILVEGAYHLLCSGNTLLVDVGANVGFASLHLASRNPSMVVAAFEPIIANCERARRNLDANPALRERIQLHPVGLFSESGRRTIQSARQRRGMSSLVLDRRDSQGGEIEHLEITVRRASEAFADLLAQCSERRIVMKMDCEGSEYAILGDLMATGLLRRIDMLLLEWHRISQTGDEVGRLFQDLRGHGFHVHVPGPQSWPRDAGIAVCCNTGEAKP